MEKPKRYITAIDMEQKEGDWKRHQAKLHLDIVFSDEAILKDHRGLETTLSDNGNERVRAFMADEDGDLGYSDNESFVGIVKLNKDGKDVYLAEQHYPNHENSPTYLYEYTPQTNELTTAVINGGSNQEQFELPTVADKEAEEQFLHLSREVAYAYRFQDYEGQINRSQRKFYNHEFMLEELR